MTTFFALPLSLCRSGWRREWVAIATVATVGGFVLASREAPRAPAEVSAAQGWVGELTAAMPGAPETKPLSSSSLVVPSAELALPAVAKVPIQIRNACDSADDRCAIRPLSVVAARRQASSTDAPGRLAQAKRGPEVQKVTLTNRPAEKQFSLNPFDHLPDSATIGRPFEAAGLMVRGWIRRL